MRNLIHRIVHVCGFAAMLLTIGSTRILGQDAAAEAPVDHSLNSLHARDIIEAVMEHHVDPPTRQQLILEVLRGVAEAESDRLPSDLSTRISAISDTDSLYSFLDAERERLTVKGQSAFRIDTHVLARLNRIVPGGVRIVPLKEYVVNEQLTANRYVGIGVRTALENQSQRIQFINVMPGGTAEAAGILDGDVVEAVDGMDTFNVSISDVIQWIRGPEESVVRLTVRSPGKESREVEIVRRVVPLKTLKIIEQTQNTTAALIRIDRLTSSTVHELRTIIDDLPIMVTSIILDLRFTMDGNTHQLHLLAIALLDKGRLGHLITRSGARLLTTEAGTVLKDRKAAIVYKPRHSEQIDWLATVLHEREFPIFRDEFSFREIAAETPAAHQSIIDFVPMRGGTHYIGLATTELLTSNAEQVSHEKPLGQSIEPYVAKPSASFEWLTKLAGLDDLMKPSSAPLAVLFNQDGTLSVFPLPTNFQPFRAPVTDDAIVERIVAYLKVQ
ncbi:MAG: PDZ domain-containing protein [Planctomycetota bacterium]|nr:PDZ domain-containing protein [Planctomycetota bacterium]